MLETTDKWTAVMGELANISSYVSRTAYMAAVTERPGVAQTALDILLATNICYSGCRELQLLLVMLV